MYAGPDVNLNFYKLYVGKNGLFVKWKINKTENVGVT